ncbi:Stk1 family PASTA domain-containing Ser/Thr kinase [Alpinimonas psychrophila]|uniref:non-specific serine/threonine protein kinase n=1 Tax=Alpinimonas psychrophila TaxID=748908 RepID=A0A7W3PN98_9MICO|nr:protein kinase [Alpinimonas psychrophila]MBA8828016.1 serine/threonine-protein kinase [Alpinimonas psychrophila]
MSADKDGLISDRYQLGGLLGSGASASVYEATDMATGERVALKILHPQFSQTAALRVAFLEEARITAGITHPNLAAVLDFGIHDPRRQNRAWIAMEFASGMSLAEFIETVGLPSPAEALAVADGVLDALSAIHDSGLVHRDVTPHNIMVEAGPDGFLTASGVHLIDFGLVDIAGESSTGTHVLRHVAPAHEGERAGVIGSANYISPEQARGNGVDSRGDLYQVGCVLYFALTGQPPFPAHTHEETLHAHAVLPPPVPSVLRPEVSAAIDRIVVRAMLKAPVSRFGSVADFRASILAANLALQRSAENTTDIAIAGHELDASHNGGRTRVLPRTSVAEDGNRTALIGGAAFGQAPGRDLANAARGRSAVGAAASGRRSSRSFWLVVIPTLLAAVVGVSVVSAGASTSAIPATDTGSPTPPPTSPSPTPSTFDGPAMISVPAIGGSQAVAARILILRSGLKISGERVEDSSLAADTVLALTPGAGELVAPGTSLSLVIASGSNRVPTLVGVTQAEAITLLHAAGFTVVITTGTVQGPQPGHVMESSPSAGASLRLGSSVTVVLAPPDSTAPSTTVTQTPAPTVGTSSTPVPAA